MRRGNNQRGRRPNRALAVDPPDANNTTANEFLPRATYLPDYNDDSLFPFLSFLISKIQPQTTSRIHRRKEEKPHVGRRAKKARRTIEGRTRPEEYKADSMVRVARGLRQILREKVFEPPTKD